MCLSNAYPKEAEMNAIEEEKRRQAQRQQIIEEERQRLLKEHAEKTSWVFAKGRKHLIILAFSIWKYHIL